MDRLNSDTTLDKGNEIASANGTYKLKMQPDGNLVLYGGTQPIWATNTQGKGAERLEMQGDGNLVVYAKDKDDVWSAKTNRNKGAYLQLQNDGNLVVYSKDGKEALWASDTAGKYTAPATTSTPVAAAAAAGAATAAMATPVTAMQDKAANIAAAPVAKPAVAANAGASKAAPTNKAANARTYTVAKGDSLWKIAEKIYGNGTDYKKIAKANSISNPDHIQPGQKLVIPE